MNMMIEGKQCTLVIFVDDILALSEDTSALRWVERKLKERLAEVTYKAGKDISYLGMDI
jgi:hypothetical protein